MQTSGRTLCVWYVYFQRMINDACLENDRESPFHLNKNAIRLVESWI